MLLEKRIPIKYIFKGVDKELLIVLIFMSIVHLSSDKLFNYTIPINLPAFLGTAISLVLSFKLGQSYDRWWEARKIWGAIVNDSRTLAMQALHLTARPADNFKELRQRMAYRQIAWCYSLGQTLREQSPFENIDGLLSKEEFSQLEKHKNVPLKLVQNHHADLEQLHHSNAINDYQQTQINDTLVRLVESMGKAERIKNTVFPRTYRVFLHFFIYVFIFTLSLALKGEHTWIDIPLLMLIITPFLLLERTAFYIQDPFENRPTDTAVTAIAITIDTNIRQLIGDEDLPTQQADKGYYLM